MQTLLEKIRAIEEQTVTQQSTTEKEGQATLARLKADEERVLTEVRAGAEAKAADIIKQRTQAARAEINSLHQDEEQSVNRIREQAQKQRSRALERIQNLVREEYLSSSKTNS